MHQRKRQQKAVKTFKEKKRCQNRKNDYKDYSIYILIKFNKILINKIRKQRQTEIYRLKQREFLEIIINKKTK